MSDNKGQDWLDDTTAERLLRGAARNDTSGPAWTDPRAATLARTLAAAAVPAVLDPAREEAALAAFRDARDAGPELSPVRGGRANERDGGRDAAGRRSGGSKGRGARAFSGTLLATAAVAGVALAAAAGALPVLLSGGDEAPAPVHTQGAAPQATGGTRPATPAVPPSPPAPSRSGRGVPVGTVPGGAPAGPAAPGAPRLPAPPAGATAGPKALCRAYAAAGWRRGKTDEQIWKQLRKAAGGGQPMVRRYCAAVLGPHGRRVGGAGDDSPRNDSPKGGGLKGGGLKDDGPGRLHHGGKGNGKNRSGGHHRFGERHASRAGGQ
ncbi:hypothetical protein ABZ883_05845 [Streptomyces sp. NPDC046977]|uniref:hypothetical protein n=1 Tax=Streptomyces sp. NPDC046977 TaxID=3154703 RepID=UPI003406DA1C